MTTSKVYLRFERFGLCNKLIMWAKAYVFANNNNATLITSSWFHLPVGSILRGEGSLRLYRNFFTNRTSLFLPSILLKHLNRFSSIEKQAITFKKSVFNGTPLISDLVELAPYRHLILPAFFGMIHPIHKKRIANSECPVIGVHVRLGDFNKIGAATTIRYYVDLIKSIREVSGKNLPVTLFSDGYDHELKELLDLDNVKRFTTQNDLIDLVVLSKSKLLITSKGSSYSYWAAFIGEGVILHHPKTWVLQCRDENTNSEVFEGTISDHQSWPQLLIHNIQSI